MKLLVALLFITTAFAAESSPPATSPASRVTFTGSGTITVEAPPAAPVPAPAVPQAPPSTPPIPAPPPTSTVPPVAAPKPIALIASTAASNSAQPIHEPASPLDQICPLFRPDKQPIERALRLLGRPFNVTFIVDPDATDTVLSFEMRDKTLREILNAIVQTKGLFYEERAGYVNVARFRTVRYHINYPAGKRRTTGSTNINLAASRTNSNSNSVINGGSTRNTSNGANQNGSQDNQSDQATLSITKENDGDFWTDIEQRLRELLIVKGESLSISRLSGIVSITAEDDRHRTKLRPYIEDVNRRVNRQVHIKAHLVEVNLTDGQKIGVDWVQANAEVGGTGISFSGSSSTNFSTAGAVTLPTDTFTARIAAGKLSAVLNALSQQGEVHSESNPSVTTLVNQTTFIKIGEDRTFFTANSATSISGGTSTTGATTSTQIVYDQFTQSFGDVLEVTPSIDDNNIITLIAAPTVSRFKGLTTSPDGNLSGPNSDSKSTESIIRLRSGETGIMGGFVFSQSAKGKRGIPLLQRIPLLGRAFETATRASERTELAILITATIDDL